VCGVCVCVWCVCVWVCGVRVCVCVCVWTNCRALRIKNGGTYNNHVALNSNPFVPVPLGQSRFQGF